MVAVLVEKKYKYDKTTLSSGNIVSANGVIIRNGEVSNIHGGIITLGEMENTQFTASLKSDGTYNYSIEYGNSSVDVVDIILEFIAFIEKDLSL